MSKLKNNNDKGSFFHNLATQRRFRYGGFAILITCIALAAVILLNMVLGMVEDNWALSIDLSPSRVTKFDDAPCLHRSLRRNLPLCRHLFQRRRLCLRQSLWGREIPGRMSTGYRMCCI